MMRSAMKMGAIALCCAPMLVFAQSSRPVRVIVPYAAGGPLDTIARLYAQQLGENLGEKWFVENISGGNGVIGTAVVARSVPDGSTLLFSADVHNMARLVMKNVPYDPVTDFTPISQVARAPLFFVVNPSRVRATNLTELVTEIRADPKKYAFAISGLGSATHIGAEMFRVRSGVDILTVPYRGTGPAVTDLMGGQVSMMVVTPLPVIGLVKTGKLKALAVTAAQRFEGAPDVPTTDEAGMPGFHLSNSYGFWGPKGMSRETVARISKVLKQIAENPERKRRLLELGMEAMWDSPEIFAKHIAEDLNGKARVLKGAGVEPE
jgi:tripartite-type tricarboxylate transporter receptor subunit TctC